MPEDNTSNIDFNIESIKDNPQDNIGSQFVTWTIRSGRIILMVVVVILVVTLVSNLIISEVLNKNIDNVNEKIKIVSTYSETEKEHIKLSGKINDIDSIQKSNIDWRKRFEYLNSFIPQDMTLDSVKFNPDIIEISGSVISAEGFGLLVNKFLNNEQVTELSITGSSYDKIDNKYTFSIKIGLKEERF